MVHVSLPKLICTLIKKNRIDININFSSCKYIVRFPDRYIITGMVETSAKNTNESAELRQLSKLEYLSNHRLFTLMYRGTTYGPSCS